MYLNHLYSKLNGEIHITQWLTAKMKKICNGKGLTSHFECFNYLSLSTILMFSSVNCSSETELGDWRRTHYSNELVSSLDELDVIVMG